MQTDYLGKTYVDANRVQYEVNKETPLRVHFRTSEGDSGWMDKEQFRRVCKEVVEQNAQGFSVVEAMIVTMILGLIVALMISSVTRLNRIGPKESPAPETLRISRYNSILDEYEYQGHRYLSSGHGIIHAEHCSCKTSHIVTAGSYVVLPEAGQIDPKQLPPMWDHFGNRILFEQPPQGVWITNYGRRFEGTYTNPFRLEGAK